MNALSKTILAGSAVLLVILGGGTIAVGLFDRQPTVIFAGVAVAIGAYLVAPE